MGARGRQHVEGFLASTVVTRIEQLYRDIMNPPPLNFDKR